MASLIQNPKTRPQPKGWGIGRRRHAPAFRRGQERVHRRLTTYAAALLTLVAVLAAACSGGGSSLETPEAGSPVASAAASDGGRVLYVATDGGDAADGSVEHPWRTLQHAADSVLPGDTVLVEEGSYHEEVALTRSGEANRPIGFRAAAGDTVTLEGGGELGSAFTIGSGTSQVWLRGFRLTDYRGWSISLEGNNRDIVISGIDSSGSDSGVHLTLGEHGKPEEGPVDRVLIQDSDFHHHRFGGIDCTPGPCNRLQISNVRSYHNGEAGDWGADGIAVEMGEDIRIEGCQVYENGGDGIDLNSRDSGPVSGIEVRGCQVWGNKRNGIKLWRGGRIRDSLVHSMGSAGIAMGSEGAYEIVSTLVARSGLDGDYGVVVAYPEESGPQSPVTLRLRNSIFAFNNGGIYLGENVKLDEDYDLFFSRDDCEIEAAFSDREDGCFSRDDVASGVWFQETGNGRHSLDADPRFVDAEGGDYHLRPESPARDVGDPEQGGTPDMEGRQRPWQGGVDMGPYEAP